jgi:peptidoglycan hydrolase-like protein with peptidoglycan-binding domain
VRRVILIAVAVILVAGAGALIVAGTVGFGATPAASSSTLPPATTTVARGTLVATDNVDGTLGYGDETVVSAHANGTITALPALGATVKRGQAVFRVDDLPIPLLYGRQPVYRRLAPGVEGADVTQFEKELAALGYTGFTVDDSYTSATAAAVKQWQEDLGLDETGTIDVGQVVVAPSPIRVSKLTAGLGDNASGPVLSYTGTSRRVSVDLDVAKQDLAKVGAAATVQLPNGTTVPGKVSAVGTVATSTPASQGQQATTTVEVEVTLNDQSKLGSYDEAPVSVTLVAEQRENVLVVPVSALLALAEGGYGVQIVDNGQTRIVAVKTGLFANNKVEISGDGITEGTVVGMPS